MVVADVREKEFPLRQIHEVFFGQLICGWRMTVVHEETENAEKRTVILWFG